MNNDNLPIIGTVATAQIDSLTYPLRHGRRIKGTPILLTAPYPESFYAFHRLVQNLVTKYPVLLVDCQLRPLTKSSGMLWGRGDGRFCDQALSIFGFSRTHSVSPDVGTPAVLFAAQSTRPV